MRLGGRLAVERNGPDIEPLTVADALRAFYGYERLDEQHAVLARAVVVVRDPLDLEPQRLVERDGRPRSRAT